jgi:pimeloyl-ACP methyl ester carboxylesterase
LLGGWSFGGILAFEVACRLARDGQQVAGLLIFDAAPRTRALRWRNKLWRLGLRLLRGLVRRRATRTVLDWTRLLPPLARALVLLPIDEPLSPAAIREIIQVAFPELSAKCDDAGSDFDLLCDILVARLRPHLPKAILKGFERAVPAGQPIDFVRFFHLQWKNICLSGGHEPSTIYDGPIVIYVPEENTVVSRWQRYCRRPLDIRRVRIVARDGMSLHSSFLHPQNLSSFADDVRCVLSTLTR